MNLAPCPHNLPCPAKLPTLCNEHILPVHASIISKARVRRSPGEVVDSVWQITKDMSTMLQEEERTDAHRY